MISFLYNNYLSVRCYVDGGKLYWMAADVLPLINTSSKRTLDVLSVFFSQDHTFRRIIDLPNEGRRGSGFILTSEEMLHLAEKNPQNNQLLAWVYSVLTQSIIRVSPKQPVYRLLYPGEQFPFITVWNLDVCHIPPHPSMRNITDPKRFATNGCQTDLHEAREIETQMDPIVIYLSLS
ncbi:hypothetical protein X975_15327, partial [Stegodyphus mimosarum]